MVGIRQFDENRVLAAALEVFWRKGLHATTMQDLADATHVQRGSLYNAFGSKEHMFTLAFDRYAESFLGAAGKALARADAREALEAFFQVAIENMTSGRPPRGCLTTRTAVSATENGEAVQRRVRCLLDRLTALVSSALARPHVERQLAIAPERAARVVVTFTRGLAVMERAGSTPAQLQDAAKALFDMLIRDQDSCAESIHEPGSRSARGSPR